MELRSKTRPNAKPVTTEGGLGRPKAGLDPEQKNKKFLQVFGVGSCLVLT